MGRGNGVSSAPPSRPTRINIVTSERLSRAFKRPESQSRIGSLDRPTRKRRKLNYSEAGEAPEGSDVEDALGGGLVLTIKDVNKYPVYKVKDKETQFRQRFSVPFVNKCLSIYNPSRPAPTLGMRRGVTFVAKPLHDPSGEFAIVLYDPTIDEKPLKVEQEKQVEEPTKITVPLMHKSLAEILGIKKDIGRDRPKLPVVIDPKLAKVLRPHQVEGVKVTPLD